MRNSCINLGEKPQGRKIHGRLRFMQENDIILDLTDIMNKDLKQIQMFQPVAT
jgi:hypothetical protein